MTPLLELVHNETVLFTGVYIEDFKMHITTGQNGIPLKEENNYVAIFQNARHPFFKISLNKGPILWLQTVAIFPLSEKVISNIQ